MHFLELKTVVFVQILRFLKNTPENLSRSAQNFWGFICKITPENFGAPRENFCGIFTEIPLKIFRAPRKIFGDF